MLRRSWSRWVIIVGLLLAAFAVYGVACALFQEFNEKFGIFEKLTIILPKWLLDLDPKKLSVLGPIVPIAYGLWKTWTIFERNLPSLLQSYLKKYSQHIFRERDDLLAVVAAEAEAVPAKAGLFATRRDLRRQRILSRYIGSIDAAEVNSRSDVTKLNDSFDVAALAKNVRSYELATAHFIRGKLHAIAAERWRQRVAHDRLYANTRPASTGTTC